MHILVLNTGSSSVKVALVQSDTEQVLLDGLADWSVSPARFEVRRPGEEPQVHAFPERIAGRSRATRAELARERPDALATGPVRGGGNRPPGRSRRPVL